jgi:hypothetical protein
MFLSQESMGSRTRDNGPIFYKEFAKTLTNNMLSKVSFLDLLSFIYIVVWTLVNMLKTTVIVFLCCWPLVQPSSTLFWPLKLLLQICTSPPKVHSLLLVTCSCHTISLQVCGLFLLAVWAFFFAANLHPLLRLPQLGLQMRLGLFLKPVASLSWTANLLLGLSLFFHPTRLLL